MLNINLFIKNKLLLDEASISHREIINFNEVDALIRDIVENKCRHIVFKNTALKNFFLYRIQQEIDVNIVNCDSCISRFCEDLTNGSKLTIFNNINKCNNSDIIDIITNNAGIIIY